MNRDAIDFENGNVGILFRKLLIPTLIGSLAISAVTAIDGIFIGHGVGAMGVAAVNIVVPIFQIMSGLGLMVGAGCSVVASIHLSQNKIKAARLNVTQAILFTTIIVLLFCVFVHCFPDFTSRVLGSSETLLPQVKDYLLYIVLCFVFEMWSMVGLFIIRLDGAPKYAMWCNILPAVLNVVLDWLFIFPLGMGVKGAAIATSISVSIGGFMAISYILFYSRNFRLIKLKMSIKSLILSLRNIGYQCKIGLSSLLGELTLAVLIYVGNLVFMRYLSDDGVGAFGIACYYAPFFFMVGNAIAQSAQPIISYNYGVDRWDNIRKARKLLINTSFLFGILVTILFVFFPTQLVALFVDPTDKAGVIAIEGFPYFATGIVFFILNVAIVGYYQSVELVRKATFLVFLRGLIFLVPCFVVLPMVFGVKGIWLAMPVAEMLTLFVVLFLFKSRSRNSQ